MRWMPDMTAERRESAGQEAPQVLISSAMIITSVKSACTINSVNNSGQTSGSTPPRQGGGISAAAEGPHRREHVLCRVQQQGAVSSSQRWRWRWIEDAFHRLVVPAMPVAGLLADAHPIHRRAARRCSPVRTYSWAAAVDVRRAGGAGGRGGSDGGAALQGGAVQYVPIAVRCGRTTLWRGRWAGRE